MSSQQHGNPLLWILEINEQGNYRTKKNKVKGKICSQPTELRWNFKLLQDHFNTQHTHPSSFKLSTTKHDSWYEPYRAWNHIADEGPYASLRALPRKVKPTIHFTLVRALFSPRQFYCLKLLLSPGEEILLYKCFQDTVVCYTVGSLCNATVAQLT